MQENRDEARRKLLEMGIDWRTGQPLNKSLAASETKKEAPNDLKRGLARAGKATAKGLASFGDLANILVNPFVEMAGFKPFGMPSQDVDRLFDEYTNGLTTPRNNAERVVDTASEFVANAAVPASLAAKAPMLAKMAPSTLKELAQIAGIGAGTEIGHQLAPESILAPIAGGLAAGALPGVAGYVGKAAMSPRNALAKGLKINPEQFSAFEETGIPPTLGDVSGQKTVSAIQNSIKDIPLAGGPLMRAMDEAQNDITSFFQKNKINTSITQGEAGEVAQKGLRQYQSEHFKRTGELAARKNMHLRPDSAIPISNTLEKIKSVPDFATPEARRSFNKSVVGQLYTSLENMAARNEGAIPYADLSQILEDVSNSITAFGKVGDKEQGLLKDLRKRVQQDVGDYFKSLGPTAAKDFEEYNKFYSTFAKKNERVIEKMLGNKTATETFKDIINNQRVDGRKAKMVLDSLTPEEKEIFSGSLIRELGSTVENDFSPTVLAKKWKGLEPEVQGILLSPYSSQTQKQFRQVLDAVDSIAKSASVKGALGFTAGLGLGSSFASLLYPLAIGAAARTTSQLFASPKFINWLAKAQAVQSPQQATTHIKRLGAIAKSTPALAADISRFIENMKQNENQTFDLSNSVGEADKRPETAEAAREMLKAHGIDWQTGKPIQQEKSNELIDKIAYVESGNNPNAKSQTSSASGLLQFTNDTWKEAVKRYGADTGIGLRDKNNPEAQKVMASLMLQDNGRELQQFLGRRPNDTELYLTHFLGLDGAKKLLRYIGSGQPAAKVLPQAARANRNIFFASGRPRTVEEVYSLINTKI